MKHFNKIKNIFLSEVALLDVRHNLLAFGLGCVALSPLIGFLPSLTPFYYLLLVLVAVKMAFSIRKIEPIALVFIIACALSIVLASPPSFFKSWGRLGLFLLVFIAVSPLIQSKKTRSFRESVLQLTLFVSVIVGLVSFVFYFLGINFMWGTRIDTIDGIGTFGGLTKHSMVLGPISAIATIYCSYRALVTKNNLYWLLAVPCMACVLFSASRTALIAALCGLMSMFYVVSASNNRVLLKRFYPIIGILLVSFPLWQGALSGVKMKQQNNIEHFGGTFGSREDKWENRLEEFKGSPVWGVGFSACDPLNYGDYNKDLGATIEPGSSWLAVLSMTGLIGFIPFAIIAYRAMQRVWNCRKNNLRVALYIGLIVFLFFHMLSEGYVLAGGSCLCFICWLIIACCYDV